MLRPGEYYAGRTILLTGATGLVGRAVLETLLRRLPQVHRVYIVIRPRKGDGGALVSPAATLASEVLGSKAFDALREYHGENFTEFAGARVRAIAGDVTRSGLGLDPGELERLADEVDLVINCAALAVFDAPLDQALRTNALSPGHVLEFAAGAAQPPFVAHVSTCYVNNLAGPVFETDPVPGRSEDGDPSGRFDVDEELAELQSMVAEIEASAPGGDDALLRRRMVDAGLEHARRRGWNDTYTFTKALGEQFFARHRGSVPALILRPSIIESAVAHPAPGWIDGFRMVDPLIVGFARGQIFEFPGHPRSVLDVIPVDRVVNALLMAIPWCHRDGGPGVFQVASGMDNPLRLAVLRDNLIEYFERTPLRRAPNGARARPLPRLSFPETGPFLQRLQRRHLRPLRLLTRLYAPLRGTSWGRHRHATFAGRHGRLQRLHDMAAIYGPYAQSRVRYMTCNTRALVGRMSPAERGQFPCLADDLDWRHYIQEIHIPGIERYLLNMHRHEPVTGTPDGAGEAGAADNGSVDADGRHWEKAQRVLAGTRVLGPDAAAPWTRRPGVFGLQWAAVGLIRGICRTYLHLRVSGREHLPERGPYIVVSNHCSHADTAVLLAALGGQAAQVHPTAAADYWFRSRLLGWLLHGTLAAIPFDRHASGVPHALALPAEVLRTGDALIFYPEGTRSPDGNLRRFKSTIGLLALAAAAPIVPAHIEGTTAVLPKGRAFPRSRPVNVHFGAPIGPDPYLRHLATRNLAAVARDLARDSHAAVERLAEVRDEPREPARDSRAVSGRSR